MKQASAHLLSRDKSLPARNRCGPSCSHHFRSALSPACWSVLIKPLQRVVVGDADNGGNWFWLSVGSAFIALGSTFAVVDTLALGAGIRAGEKPKCVVMVKQRRAVG